MKKENDYIVDSIERYPDRLIGACLIDPSWDNVALAELNRMVKLGIRIVKIKFSSRQIPANSPLAKKIMLEVDNLGILALLHSDWSFWTNPSIIGDLMSNYPDTCVVMQHLGLTQNAEALEVLRNNSNIYADSSAVVYPNTIVRFINEVSSDHLMFGSDTIRFYETTMPQEELDRVLNLDLAKTTIDKILGKNAERLLKKVGGIE
jgi:predicted TIM-barrel fold metal-dependent hydrolase